ncbi:hypothetical protein SCHPADRAFT_64870 [Schizopora paradoxa]|uniref:Uncharacterized protein n=1 Tax=Schizopora paradoxa TaxID=27342 RepID=A0A0H2S5J1_9AGAM|nr:hypothetical protein SCHPADRAFT_64870 [Schizopora paradoxa]
MIFSPYDTLANKNQTGVLRLGTRWEQESRDRFYYYTRSQDATNETKIRTWSWMTRLNPPKSLLPTSLRSGRAFGPTQDPSRTVFSWMPHRNPMPLALFALMNCGTLNCCEGRPASSQHPSRLPIHSCQNAINLGFARASALRPTLSFSPEIWFRL